MEVQSAWGVDLTSVTVRAVKMDLTEAGRPRIVAWDVVDYCDQVEDITDLARFAVMSRGLYHFFHRHDLGRSRVFVSMRSETAFNRTVLIPPVTDQGLDRILEYEARQQIPFALEDVFWDRRVIAIRDDGEIQATIYAIRKQVVEERLRRLARTRMPVDGLQLRPLALQNFCAAERLLEQGTVVVDVDYAGIQILVHHDDQTWFRALPVGGVDYVQRIREVFAVSHQRAVAMAVGRATITQPERLEAVREEVAASLAGEVSRIVSYYLAAHPKVQGSGVVLFQSHAVTPPLRDALKRALKLPVFEPKGFRHVEVHPDVVSAGIQENFHDMVRAVGLGLQSLGKAEVDVRLYPPDMQRPLRGGRWGYAAAAFFLLVLLGLGAWRRDVASTQLATGTAELELVLRDAYKRSELLADPELTARSILRSLDELADLPGDRTGPLPLVETIYRALDSGTGEARPYLVSMTAEGWSEGRPASVIVAVPEGGEEPAVLVIQRFASILSGATGVSGVEPGETWVSGELTAEAPGTAPSQPLRWRYVHQRLKVAPGGRP